MIPWWKRLAYGLVSWVTATCVVGLLLSIWAFTRFGRIPGGESTTATDVLDFFWPFVLFAFILGSLGWLLWMPFILFVKDFSGWHFLTYLVVGSCIGPVVILGLFLFDALRQHVPHIAQFLAASDLLLRISAAISSFTTLIYVLLLRRAQLARESNLDTPQDQPE